MNTAEEWLNGKIEFSPEIKMTRLEFLGRIISKNGGHMEIHGWGITSSDGPFGRGLKQEEALALIRFGGFLDGLYEAGRQDLMFDIVKKIGEFVVEAEKAEE